MASRGERIAAWTGVVISVISVSAVSVAVIIDQLHSKDATADIQNAVQAQSSACPQGQTDGEATLPAPDVYKPDGKVAGLQITDLVAGSGSAVKSGDCLIVKYYGTLASNGTMFDEDYTKPTALRTPIGQGQVIQGWDQGLIGMKVGGVRRLVIPSALGYGAQGSGSSIPPDSDLVFVVKLLRIQ